MFFILFSKIYTLTIVFAGRYVVTILVTSIIKYMNLQITD